MMFLGNQTSFAAATPFEPFHYAITQGFEAFEWFPDKKPDGAGWEEEDLDASQRQVIRETAHAHGLRLSVHARCGANPLQEEAMPRLRRNVELARDLGAVLFNLHLDLEAGLAAYLKAIQPLVADVASAGLWLAIENTPWHSPEDFNALFARLRDMGGFPWSQVGMCLDLGHANLCAATRNDYLQFLDQLSVDVPIIHVHLHENWGDYDSHLTLFTGPSGRDDSGLRGLLARLGRRDFSGAMIFEQWPQPPSLLDQARDRLRKLLRELEPPNACASASHLSPELPSAGGSVSNPAADPFPRQLVELNQQCRSWREKLDRLRGLLAQQAETLTVEQWMDVAIYLRFLGAGEIPCAEDGRHFRPAHHARISAQIQAQLSRLSATDLAPMARKIYPWLPSSAAPFLRAEPLTRIRDLAHRNDIPSELKRELKQTLQNKLHRCAGPEDLRTSAALLQRITAAAAQYPAEFVAQFKIFHEELKEFFNARSLEDQLTALLTQTGDSNTTALIQQLMAAKARPDMPSQLATLKHLTTLRGNLIATIEKHPGAETQELRLAEIGLEDFAFVRLSEIHNALETAGSAGFPADLPVNGLAQTQAPWRVLLEVIALTLENLKLSRVEVDECVAVLAETRLWQLDFSLSQREKLLGLKATADRGRRLAEDYSTRLLGLFQPRVKALGRALGVAEPVLRTYSEAEVRRHLVFQLAKFLSSLSRRLREALNLPAWDIVVTGQVTGRIKLAPTVESLEPEANEPVILLLKKAEGDEELPAGVRGVILAQAIPHLSHLALRARQAGVAVAADEESSRFNELSALSGQWITLTVTPDKVEWAQVQGNPPPDGDRPARRVHLPETSLNPACAWMALEQVTPATGGSKAVGLRRLVELSASPGAGFKTRSALVIPFGVMERSLATTPAQEREYKKLLDQLTAGNSEAIIDTASRLRTLIQQIRVPDELVSAVVQKFGPPARLMVRSSANCEDLANAAGAGLYESVANVAPAAMASAVRTVWSSLWTPRAVLSRAKAGIPPAQAHMAVLLQEMLAPDYAFVMHSVNPIDQNSRQVYVEMVVGLGEALASASVRGTPYRLLIDKDNGELRLLALANLSQALWPRLEGGNERRLVDYSQIEFTLEADFRRALGGRLAASACMVEQAFGQPQDLEGAIVKNEIFLLQARPQPSPNRL